MMSFIPGRGRTADIERIRMFGAHAARRLTIYGDILPAL
jgi:L-lactate utilization protein LutC